MHGKECCLLLKGRTAGAASPCTPAHDGAVCWARGMFYVIHCDATRGRGIRHHQTSSGSICQPGPCLHAAPGRALPQCLPVRCPLLAALVCCYLPHSSYILHCLSAFIISFSYCSDIQNKQCGISGMLPQNLFQRKVSEKCRNTIRRTENDMYDYTIQICRVTNFI